MTWSTRQLADLAGTTVKAVRYYHEVGLLEEPERAANGYKQYGVRHLVRVLRIKRLVDLGLPLAQIADLGEADDRPESALRVLDAELAATIERLQRVRAELAVILGERAPFDLPEGFGTIGGNLPDADRALILIYSRVFDPAGMVALREMVRTSDLEPEARALESLPPDADESLRQEVAEAYAARTEQMLAEHPAVAGLRAKAPRGFSFADEVINRALHELYNPAQLDVLHRVNRILNS
ncbi:MerR family transcriptional regulator [Cryptosporangium arvum]|jgi:DNA-binding transcriptional MerR regulator|uniref:Putative transcriptional regulator n=1 Tax=Cryptosporangium arvum DSM 44712 TaxID=927661 RepID=A0A010YR98_9ACTN|nr:MerR family transcriptional regulator [Cryptosporangium arvum]EXG82715.1 putative transcriptional regulator [Cryptosporangium arvum DSM 44712]